MTSMSYKFEAIARRRDGATEPFVAETVELGFREDRGHYCTISCPNLRLRTFTLYGRDAEQALEMAVGFVRVSLWNEGIVLLDANGERVELPPFGGIPSEIRFTDTIRKDPRPRPWPYKFEAIARRRDGATEPFIAETTETGQREDAEYFCKISCPVLQEKPFTVCGVDAEQALELAVELVQELMRYEGIVLLDADGNEVELPEFGGVPAAIRYGNAPPEEGPDG